MGREIRRVPAGWEHPKKPVPNYRTGRMEERYRPMRDRSVESAWAEWQEEYAKWIGGEHDRVLADKAAGKYEGDYPKNEPYRAFCSWHGDPPDPEYYRPDWPEDAMTWYQVYETVSEGTPVTPPFATREELVEYLVANGDFWDQNRRAEEKATGCKCSMACGPWDRKQAEAFVFGSGWAPSMMVVNSAAGVDIKTAGHGFPEVT